MKRKHKMDFQDKGDVLAFIWCIVLAIFLSISITEFGLPWIIIVYFTIGMFTSLVLEMWVTRNKEVWKSKQKG